METSAETNRRVCADGAHALRVEVVNPLEDAAWDEQVKAHPRSTIFHHRAWAAVLLKSYQHRPLYLRLWEKGRVLALVPLMEVRSWLTGRRGVCLPFSDMCEPLLFGRHAAEKLMIELGKQGEARNWKYFELRGGETPDPVATPSARFYVHQLDLRPGAEALLGSFKVGVRNAIRKAERSGLTVETSRDPKAMREFFELHSRTRRRHGLPPQPYAFFEHVQREVIERGFGFIVVARKEGKAVGAAVYFHCDGNGIYKYGASDERWLEFRPNNLVMWQAIKSLIELGCETLDFGRTSTDNEGLRRFKVAWGTKEGTVEYFQQETSRHTWRGLRANRSHLSHGVFRNLPLTLNRLAGAVLYPHLH